MRLLFLALVLSACGPKHTNQCPDNHTGACVNGDKCSFDHRRGCNVCECRPFDETPMGHDPDDPNPAPK